MGQPVLVVVGKLISSTSLSLCRRGPWIRCTCPSSGTTCSSGLVWKTTLLIVVSANHRWPCISILGFYRLYLPVASCPANVDWVLSSYMLCRSVSSLSKPHTLKDPFAWYHECSNCISRNPGRAARMGRCTLVLAGQNPGTTSLQLDLVTVSLSLRCRSGLALGATDLSDNIDPRSPSISLHLGCG
ncbi:hypothetical protein NEOLEDRAFT_130847 [Neolentinus lepideus HHB14362 ss-1]|uniref:Uncharacterized protein n=1 Tax=Neolentinus lepideus HHB14362 ss-1 TaxID=1314782 RepID=A0A165TWS6_9AGAM|nr:hypothetical protein NEOLEDRAFT_130847 [Neolentinus lepideus HHB14362 ss-1]